MLNHWNFLKTGFYEGIKFEDEPDEDDRETLAGQVFSQLATASGLPYADIKELVGEDDHNTELRNLVARIIKVVV